MSQVTVIAPRSRHSPCVGICKLDEASGYCLGCARTGDEIGRWSGMSEAQRDAVWALLPERHDALSISMRLLPWTPEDIGDWVQRTMQDGLGTWTVGAPGALAVFPCRPGAGLDVSCRSGQLVGRMQEGVFCLNLHDKLRAFSFGSEGPIVLAWPKARGAMPVATTFAALGVDQDAIEPAHRGDHLFDMGIGRQASRFCIRTGDKDLVATLNAMVGRPWAEVMREAGMSILAANPHRVVESRLARVEVYAPIPLPGAPSPDGPHTQLLPQYLASGEEAPSGLMPAEFAWPIAIFYPR